MSNNDSPALPERIEGSSRKQRSGFRLVVTGLLASGLVITALVFYSFAVLDDNNKLSQQLDAVIPYLDQAAEKTLVMRYDQLLASGTDTYNIMIRISNEAPILSTYRYVLLYCTSDAECLGDPVVNPASIADPLPLALKPGEERQVEVGPVADGLMYRIDVITERGNVISTEECQVDLARQICQSPSVVAGIK